ncbi:YibE/F-like protein [Bacteroidales bacterium Barb4]|nr:YibE/F-like protein [Bacteroidales bacterium Barb4]
MLTATGIVFFCTTTIILLVGGVNRKGLVALLGTIAGVSVTALLAVVFGYYFKIPGTIQEFSEALLYTGFVRLDFSDIFISVIFVSSAGAVMDVAMDISAALHELSSRMPELQRKELIKSGFRIASPVIGSMTTTLLFAYSGSFMFAFMAFMVKGTSVQSILNSGYIAAEILHTLVGSFGLVLVGPLTAAIGGYVYSLNGSCNRTVTTTFQSRNFPVLLLLREKINKNKFKRLRR